jgi:serine protease AprX
MIRGSVRTPRQLLVQAFGLFSALVLVVLPVTALSASAKGGNQKIAPPLLAQMAANPLQRVPVIVQMNTGASPFAGAVNVALAQQAVAILQSNGQSVGALPIIQGAAGYATAAGIQAMSLLPQVAAIDQDAVVRPRRPAGPGPASPASRLTSLYPLEVKATHVWQQGGSGRGVTVAVLDSGVAPTADLPTGRVLASVGFAGAHNAQQPDRGGHGTHIAGTIAGNGAYSAGQFVGMAPQANIIDVQVLDTNGNGRYSSILRGIEWVLAHQSQFNIRVINLSFGAPTQGASYKTDPLAAGVEIAWKHGLVVVTAAGNGGPSGGTVESPAIDPYVIAVGSTDDQATLTLADDTLGWWSAWGTPAQSTARPDVLASGRRIVSNRVPGSTLDAMFPDHLVTANNGATYMRLTGTSMSTAVVSGAAALLLEQQPSLKPDQVKKILTATAQSFGQGGLPAGAGAGLIDAFATTNSLNRGSANQGQRLADGVARTLYSVAYGQPLVWKNLTYLGTNWLPFTWLTLPWNQDGWNNIAWDNIAWDNIAWDNIAWDNIAWDQTSWDNIAWDNIAWDNSGWNNIAWDSFGFD